MLTDYHVHLRPDDADATPERYFTSETVDRYLEAARAANVEELGVSEHIHRFTEALEVWDHPFWQESATDDLGAYCEFVASTPLRLGIEMDFVHGREDRIASLLDRHEWDYVVGSVHFVGDGAVDFRIFDAWEGNPEPERVWRRYFELLAEAARSGLYDILAHPDLIKYWGDDDRRPRGDLRFFYEPAIEAIAESGVTVEISTAGLRKPVGELYPADAFVEMCIDAGAAFALSSDAHLPEHIGWEYESTVDRMRGWGIDRVAVFEGRVRRLEELG
ncbi:MAG TPA: histidinol-phosphatase [Solirubrobacterales bacterium]|nr:histidinol-phosphatase [Solirubrobacterales bacterium]